MFLEVTIKYLQGGQSGDKLLFFLGTKETTFFAKNLIEKCQISKPAPLSFRRPRRSQHLSFTEGCACVGFLTEEKLNSVTSANEAVVLSVSIQKPTGPLWRWRIAS